MLAQITVASREAEHEPLEDRCILRNVVAVEFVAGVIGKYRRQRSRSRDAKGGVTEKKRVVRMDDIRFEGVQSLFKGAGERDRH